ncbi:hypothetical protein [Gemmatimonas sp.]|jgi:hypothetical protein|uniref:hypothetical protein n=1 Tax=Gemmatimonas sp. TaxID=1962908 RepID=UPI0037C1386E
MSNGARGIFEELSNGTAVETVRLGDNAATDGVGPKKMTEGYAYIMPLRGYVNLGCYQGGLLDAALAARKRRRDPA